MKKLQKFIEEVELHVPQTLSESEGAGVASEGKWTASVWRLDVMNRNGRIYSTDLAERLISENKVTTANDGHWTDREYECAKAICKNPRIENNELVVDINFIDKDYEEKLLDMHKEGVKIGVSSVGWGECDEFGKVYVNSYELIRWLDFVQVPAGDVYANHEEETKNKQEKAQEESVDSDPTSELSESDKALAHNMTKIFTRRK